MQLTLSLKEKGPYRIQLINLNGEAIAQARGSGAEVFRFAVPRKGLYLLEIKGRDGSEVHKLSLFR